MDIWLESWVSEFLERILPVESSMEKISSLLQKIGFNNNLLAGRLNLEIIFTS